MATASGVTAAIVSAAAAATVAAATVAVVVADDVAAAVMGMRHDLVRHVFPARAEQLLQPDNGGNDEGDLADEKSLASDSGDRAEGQG